MLTKEQLIEVVMTLDPEVIKEHRKYSSFYATAEVEVCEADQRYFDFDISSLFGKRVVATGYWSDEDGLDLYEAFVEVKTIQHVPEEVRVIPAHDVEVWVKEG